MKHTNLLTTTAILMAIAPPLTMKPVYDTGKSGWKTDEDGNLVLQDGNPVYVNADGQESMVSKDTIATLNREAQTHREAKEQAQEKLKQFGDLDPVKAKEAIAKLKDVDDKKLIDSGEVERVRTEIQNSFSEQINAVKTENEAFKAENEKLRLDIEFGNSQFISERISIPADMFRSKFGSNFKIEDGVAVGYDQNGNKIYSEKNMGVVASFDEAVEIIVNNYANKDSILKEKAHGGTGNGGQGGNPGKGSTITREEFSKLSPTEQADIATKREVEIVD